MKLEDGTLLVHSPIALSPSLRAEVDALGEIAHLVAYGKVGWPRALRLAHRDRKAARRSIDRLLEHDFERVIVAHGNPIAQDGKAAIRATFEFLG